MLPQTRRELLASLGVAASGVFTAQGATGDGSRSARTTPTAGSWPQSGFGAANTGFAPRNVGPRQPVEPRFSRTVHSAPVVADGTVYVGSSDTAEFDYTQYLYALDAADGSVQWRYQLEEGLFGPPAVAGGTVYATDVEGYVYAVDAADGSERWRVDRRYTNFPPITVAGDTVFVRNEQRVLAALSTADGSERWTYDGVVGGSDRAGLAVADGVVYTFGSGGLVALDAADGSTVWGPTGTYGYGEPAVVGGVVYAGTIGSTPGLSAFRADDGSHLWSFQPGYSLNSPPAVAGDTAVVGSDGQTVHGVDTTDGTERWRFRTEGWVRAPLAVADGTAYVGCEDGVFYALSTETGAERWRYETGPVTNHGYAIAGGTVYVTTDDLDLLALSPGGRLPSVTPLSSPSARPVTPPARQTTRRSTTTTTTSKRSTTRTTDARTAAGGDETTPPASTPSPTPAGPGDGSSGGLPVAPVLGLLGLGSVGGWAAYRRLGDDETDARDDGLPWSPGPGGPPASVPGAPTVDVGYDDLDRGRRIGAGGEGEVYEVTVGTGDTQVRLALKEPRATETMRRSAYDRFLSEADTWASLDDHDHVVDVVAWGEDPQPWIAMEYMDGGTLAERRDDLSRDQRLWTAVAATRAVRHAHRHGVTHLDITPSNVLLREVEGAWPVPKVADWGMARALLDDDESVAGYTPQYAAPEQLDPDSDEGPDERTDVYAVGAVCYELFTGEPPADGSPGAILEAVTAGAVPDPTAHDPSLPARLDDVLGRAMAPDPADRYETAVHLRDALLSVARSTV